MATITDKISTNSVFLSGLTILLQTLTWEHMGHITIYIKS